MTMALEFRKKDPRVTITTRFGEIKIRFYPDAAPRHVENLINLVKMGFYDGTTFHRVVPGFIIQGGDPLSKSPDRALHGTGGPGYFLSPEPNDHPHKRGAVSMAKMPRESNSTRDFNDNATVESPAVTRSGIAGCFGSTTVNGPGQKASMSRKPKAGRDAITRSNWLRSAMWTMSGSNRGRCLASKIFAAASAFTASQPSP